MTEPLKINSFTIKIEDNNDEDCRVTVTSDPVIPQECEELVETPSVVMVESIMEFLHNEFSNNDWETTVNTNMVH